MIVAANLECASRCWNFTLELQVCVCVCVEGRELHYCLRGAGDQDRRVVTEMNTDSASWENQNQNNFLVLCQYEMSPASGSQTRRIGP